MKFKKFIKDNIQRISCCILCLVLIFSLSLTAFAWDGEAPGYLTQAQVNDYIKESVVVYNPQNIDVYSAFSPDVLYGIAHYSLSSNMEFMDSEYFHVMTADGDYYHSYYIYPIKNTGYAFSDVASVIGNFPSYYLSYLTDISNGWSDSGTALKCNGWHYLGNLFTDNTPATLFNFVTETQMTAYICKVTRFRDSGLISAFDEVVYNCGFGNAFDYLPTSSIVQISYASDDKADMNTIEKLLTPFSQVDVENKNLNYLASASTYSATAYDCFYAENVSLLSSEIDFHFSTIFDSSLCSKFTIPESIRGPACPEDGVVYTSSSHELYYRSNPDFFNDRAFLLIPENTSVNSYMNGLKFIVFPEDIKEPILYFKYHRSGLHTMLQILSNVDYELYGSNGSLAGSFDAENTVYSGGGVFKEFLYTSDNTTSLVNAKRHTSGELHNYPILRHCYCNNRGQVCKPSLLIGGFYGNSVVVSVFPSTLNSVGFYTWSSPDLNQLIIQGTGSNTGAPSIKPGDDITPGTDSDAWEGIVEWEELWSSDLLVMDWPEYPDLSGIFEMDDLSDIWSIPDYIVDYLFGIVSWISLVFSSFVNTYAAPLSKLFTLAHVIFEGMPAFFKFMFIFGLVCALSMKILQYSTGSISAIGSMSSNNKMRGSNRSSVKNDVKAGDD